MYINFPKNMSDLSYHLNTPLLKNSFYIISANISGAGFGFIFWTLAARLYTPEDVGTATAIVSSMALLVLLSRLGLDFSIIRYFPDGNQSKILSTSIISTSFLALVLGLVFIIGIDVWAPELIILKSKNAALYILFLISSSTTFLTGIAFNAIRKAKFTFLQNMVINFRVLFLFPLLIFGAMGIFGAVGISFLLASVFSLFLLFRLGIKLNIKVDKMFLKKTFHFSIGNYLSSLLIMAPNYLLPIMVFNILGSEKAAYYYIVYSISSLVFMIPTSISTSLYVEGSYGENLKKNTLKALFATYLILIPTTLILNFTGGRILEIFGTEYLAGLKLLKIMIFSSFFTTIVLNYISIKRVQKNIKEIVIVSGIIFFSIIGLGYLFMLMFGILGIGYAWVVGNGIGSIFIGLILLKQQWIKKNHQCKAVTSH